MSLDGARLRILAMLALLALAGVTIESRLGAQGARLRVLFFGYVEAKPRVASGIIDGDRLSDVADVAFMRPGTEISPDGTLAAFDTCRNADRGLDIVRLDNSDTRRLVDLDGDSCVDVRWSRDGTRLSYGSPVDRQLHVVDVGSGVDRILPSTRPSYGWHAWSPAGDAIVYQVGRGGSRHLEIIDISSGRTHELVGPKQFGTCELWAPDWSPVSAHIVFTTCKRELYVVNVNGTGLSRLAESAYAPRWAPDGQSIYYLRGSQLMRIAASGGPARQVGVSPYYGGPFAIGLVQ